VALVEAAVAPGLGAEAVAVVESELADVLVAVRPDEDALAEFQEVFYFAVVDGAALVVEVGGLDRFVGFGAGFVFVAGVD